MDQFPGPLQARRAIPKPSDVRGRPLVPVPPGVAAKLALYQAMRRQEVSNMELGRRLGVTEAVVSADPDHASRIEGLHAALAALDVGLVVEDAA